MLYQLKDLFSAEFRHHRANLMGVMAALIGLVLLLSQWDQAMYISQPGAGLMFASMGYLVFSFVITPRVFQTPQRDPHRRWNARNPAGLRLTWLAKFLFLLVGLFLTGVVPALLTFLLGSALTPHGFSKLVSESGSLGVHLTSLVVFGLSPLAVFGTGLPVRSSWIAFLLGPGITIGFILLILKGDFQFGGFTGSYLSIPLPLWLCVACLASTPALQSFIGFTQTLGAKTGRRIILYLCTAFAASSPVTALGSYICIDYLAALYGDRFASESASIHGASLSPNGEWVWLNVEGPRYSRVLRLNLRTKTLADLGPGTFSQVAPPHRYSYSGSNLEPEQHHYIWGRSWRSPWDPRDGFGIVDSDTGVKSTLQTLEKPRSIYSIKRDRKLLGHFQPLNRGVGRGILLLTQTKAWAVESDDYGLVTHSDVGESPPTLPWVGLHVGRTAWLLHPSNDGNGAPSQWMYYSPLSKEKRPVEALTSEDVLVASLQDDRALFHKKGTDQFFLFTMDSEQRVPMHSEGADLQDIYMVSPPLPMPHLDMATPSLLTASEWSEASRFPYREYLGWVDFSSHTIHWHPWSHRHQIIGKLTDPCLLTLEDECRLVNLNLQTGHREIIFEIPTTDVD